MTGSQSILVYRLLVREHFVTILFICLVQFGANQLREGGLDFQHKLFKNYNPPYSSRPPATYCQQHDVEVLIVFKLEIAKHTAGTKISADQSASVSELTDVSLDGDLLVSAGEAVVELRTGGQTERPLRWSCHV